MKQGVEIPVKPHVLKYLHKHLGEGYQLSESDPFGLFLFYLLRRPVTDARKDQVVAKYQARFAVHYGSYSPYQYGFKDMTGKTVYQFNNFVDQIVRNELNAYVDTATDFGITVKFAIECFMRKYDFRDEDIAYDTLLKGYQRYQRQAKIKTPAQTPRKALKQLQRNLVTLQTQTTRATGFAA